MSVILDLIWMIQASKTGDSQSEGHEDTFQLPGEFVITIPTGPQLVHFFFNHTEVLPQSS